jgi:four helix bundle protein
MTASTPPKVFDLEERTFQFADRVRKLVKRLPRTIGNYEDGKQVVRSSGSVGSNYIEGNEPLGDKDFLIRMKTARKEAKESRYWLRLLDCDGREALERERASLIQEATELVLILSAIIRRRQS